MEQSLTLIEKTAFLKGLEVLSSVPTEALLDLAERAQELHYDAGAVVFEENDPSRGSFLIIDGLLELKKGDALIRVVERGMAAGELWLSDSEPHHYTLRALTHAHVLRIERRDIDESIMDYPEIGVAMVRVMSNRLHEMINRTLYLESVIARLHAAAVAAGIEPPDLRVADPGEPLSAEAMEGATRLLGTAPTAPGEPGR